MAEIQSRLLSPVWVSNKDEWLQVYGMVFSGMFEGCYYEMIEVEEQKIADRIANTRKTENEAKEEETTMIDHPILGEMHVPSHRPQEKAPHQQRRKQQRANSTLTMMSDHGRRMADTVSQRVSVV